MFNKIFKFLKKSSISPSNKQKNRIFLAKDLKQYKIEYLNIINYTISKNWPLGNKLIDLESLLIIKLLKISLFILFFLLILFVIFTK